VLPVRLLGDQRGDARERLVQVLVGDHVGQREPDGREFAGQVLGVVLGPGGDLPVPLDNGAVPLVLAVLREQDQRRGVRGLGGERQVEQDVRVRVPRNRARPSENRPNASAS
jgi:hypothetical protein